MAGLISHWLEAMCKQLPAPGVGVWPGAAALPAYTESLAPAPFVSGRFRTAIANGIELSVTESRVRLMSEQAMEPGRWQVAILDLQGRQVEVVTAAGGEHMIELNVPVSIPCRGVRVCSTAGGRPSIEREIGFLPWAR